MTTPTIYITRGQIPDDVEVKRREWVARKHAPDLLGIGFYSARGFRCATTPQNCNVYELPSAAILGSDIYMQVRKADTFSPTVMKAFTYISASIYTQVVVAGSDGTTPAHTPTLRGPVLSLLNFDTDAPADAVERWFRASVVDAHRGREGLSSMRLWEQRDAHPLFPPKEPHWTAAVEWSRDPGEPLRDLARVAAGASIALANVKSETAVKWYALVRDDVFVEQAGAD
jgi:hypothetical protein